MHFCVKLFTSCNIQHSERNLRKLGRLGAELVVKDPETILRFVVIILNKIKELIQRIDETSGIAVCPSVK